MKPPPGPLSPQQREVLEEARQSWSRRLFGPWRSGPLISPSEIQADINWIYRSASLTAKQPEIILANSPADWGRAVRSAPSIGDPVNPTIETRLVGGIKTDLDNVGSSRFDLTTKQEISGYCSELRRNAIRFSSSAFGEGLDRGDGIGLLEDIGFALRAEFFLRINLISSDKAQRYLSFLKKGVLHCFCTTTMVVALPKPRDCLVDDRHLLHSVDQPALTWYDGTRQFFIHGVLFDQPTWGAVTRRAIPPKGLLQLRDGEQRAVAIRHYGYEAFLSELGAKIIDESDVNDPWNGRDLHYEVLQIDLRDDPEIAPARFVRVQSPSSGKSAVIRVDPGRDTKTVKGALAWTFGLSPEDYNPEVET